MSTLEEAEAQQWLIENGHMENPYEWSTWKPSNKGHFWGPVRSSIGGKLIFRDAYSRRKKVKRIDQGWPAWEWTYQYATKKEAFMAALGDKK